MSAGLAQRSDFRIFVGASSQCRVRCGIIQPFQKSVEIYDLQSAFNVSGDDKMNQELRSLRMTGDFFQKIVVTGGNERPWADEEGILHVGVIPFLLDKSIIKV